MSDSVPANSDIAIIGMAGRFPDAPDIETFWEHLRDGVESIRDLSETYVLDCGVAPATLQIPTYVRRYGVLEDLDLFAASFFGYTPHEATITDPQQRLFLECAWHALEDAGYDAERPGGLVGVFAGASMNSYLLRMLQEPGSTITPGSLLADIGNAPDFLSLRVSYKLNLQGPGVVVQTACSTSLVAVHMACQSLLNGECDLALAGGVSIQIPQVGYSSHEGGIGSPDGHCRAFDAGALGTVPGSGVGVVVLKPLRQALADRDTVRAIIKGSAMNNDGSRKAGFTAPSVEGQAAVIAESQALANVQVESIGYIEAHGTGTPLGDPIEVQALTQAFRSAGSTGTGFCALGSLKTNIGHLDAAAGVAGLIKTTLALQHRQVPPSLHCPQPNPACHFASSPFYVNTTLRPWPAPATGGPRRAGVSAFGIGGTNAHLVLEEAQPLPTRAAAPAVPQLFVLSAKKASDLERMTTGLTHAVAGRAAEELADVAATLQMGRRVFAHRRFLVAQTQQQIQQALQTGSEGWTSGEQHLQDQTVAFLIPGQGNLRKGTGAGLYQSEPVFRQTVDQCARILSLSCGLDLQTLLAAPSPQDGQARSYLQETDLAQPVQFVLSYALARLWLSWGAHPRAMLGHSLGEYVAACLAGVFTCEEALHLIALRGSLMQQMPAGAMLSVALSPAATHTHLIPGIEIAAINAEQSTVVTGPEELLSTWQHDMHAQGIRVQRLHVSRAFHSALLDPMIPAFVAAVQQIPLREPRLPYISCLTGTWVTASQATDPAYWGAQLRQPVQFLRGLCTLRASTPGALLEVGAGSALSRLACHHQSSRPDERQIPAIASLPHLDEERSERAALLEAAGHLWVAGVPLRWEAMADPMWRRVRLPGYPFERSSFWYSSRQPSAFPSTGQPDQRPDALRADPGQAPPPPSLSPPPSPPAREPEGEAPSAIEQLVMQIWRELIGIADIGGETDFFLSGGDSLIAGLVIARLTARLGREIPLRFVFEFPTVTTFALAVEDFLLADMEAEAPDREQAG